MAERDTADVVIVGAGHAGAQTAIALRQRKFEGSILLIGDEPDLPYERPPLSKNYLAGDRSSERLLIRPAEFWAERDIRLRLASRVVAVDVAGRQVECDDGARIDYGHLVWAAGGAPRRLVCSGHALAGVHAIRTRADVDRLRLELASTTTVVVIGGGFIGLEAAASLSKVGKTVIVLEAMGRVLARVAAEPVSRFFEKEHRAHGVEIRLEAQVDCIEEGNGRVSGVRLTDGAVIACEMVIVGIGITPSVGPLQAAGAKGDNGVRVDAGCRTSLDKIFAVGDCALHANRYANGALVRLESVQNANDQAAVVAAILTGDPAEYAAEPWFWSNQFDLKLQTVGLSIGHDQVVLRGNPDDRSFSLIYLNNGRVVAMDCVNAVRDFAQGRRLVAEGVVADLDKLADISLSLKTLGDLAPVK